MHKSVKRLLLLFTLAIAFLLPQSAAGQAKITLGPGKEEISKTSKSEADTSSRIGKPTGRAELHRPILSVQPRSNPGGAASAATKANEQQVTETQQAESLLDCDFSLLLVNEVFGTYLINTGVPCPGCTIPNYLSQSVNGVLGFSKNPTGPWTDTLEISAQINFSGNGNSEVFYIKGVSAGISTMRMQSPWADNYFDFQVQNCVCPSIPVVP